MSELKISGCMSVVKDMSDMDRDALLARLDQYRADGVPVERAQIMATSDTLAEIEDERREFMRMLKEQHPEIFVVTAPQVRQSADRPIFTDDILKTAIAESKALSGVIGSDIENDAQGVIPGRPRMLDRRLANGTYTDDDVKAEFPRTLAAIRAAHGEELTLWRADAPDDRRIAEAKTVYMADQDVATKYANNGRQALPYRVKTDDLLGVYARPSGYYEAIVRIPEGGLNSATGEDSGADIRKSADRTPLGFYSALARSIEGAPIKSAPAGAWKTAIKGLLNKGAIKQDELEWSGLEDWMDLRQGKISKERVTEYLKQGGVQVDETVLGESNPHQEFDNINEARKFLMDFHSQPRTEFDEDYEGWSDSEIIDSANDLFREAHPDSATPTKYGQYTLPGGTNYREVLLTLPVRLGVDDPQPLKIERRDDGAYVLSDKYGPVKTVATMSEAQAYRERRSADDMAVMLRKRERDGKLYRSSHWYQPNVLAHIRVNDRTDADGSKVLFVEEIQSDWGQEGKRKGFSSEKQIPAGWSLAQQGDVWVLSDADGEVSRGATRDGAIAAAIKAGELRESDLTPGVPAAPFVTKTEGWLNLALKRVMIMAAEGSTSGSQAWLSATKPQRVREEFEQYFGPELAAVLPLEIVDTAMLGSTKNDQILRLVVESVPVDVVNILADNGITPEELVRQPNVVAKGLPPVSRAAVARGLADALALVGARSRTVLRGVLTGKMAGRDRELDPAISAGYFEPNVVVRLLSSPSGGKPGSSLLGIGGSGAGDAAKSPVAGLDNTGEGGKLSPAELAVALNRHDAILNGEEGDSVSKYEPPSGYQKIAFVTGDQSADRYDLSKQVESISYKDNGDGTYRLVAAAVSRGIAIPEQTVERDKLPDVVGKEVADKIISGEGTAFPKGSVSEGMKKLSGLDLKVGGAGMKAFYDTIVPSALKKLLPKVGGGQLQAVGIHNTLKGRDVVAAQLPDNHLWGVYDRHQGRWLDNNDQFVSDPEDAGAYSERAAKSAAAAIMKEAGETLTQPGFDVTPAMREKVAGGLPLFSRDRATWTDARIDRLLDTHAYTMDDAKTKAYAGFVSPEDYLRATTPASGVERLERENRPLDEKELAGETQPIFLLGEPQSDGTWKTTGHEGRHRMMALRDAGVRRVPVVFDVGYGLKREPLEGVYVTPQRWSGEGSAQGGFFVDSLIPISYKHAKDLRETFGGDGAVRFSPDRAQTETPEFKRWFGNSKVVDENGDPLVVYHGTTGAFDVFDTRRQPVNDDGYMGVGSYFIADRKDAENYADMAQDNAPGAPRVIEAYLSIKNPYRLPGDSRGTYGMTREQAIKWTDDLIARGYDGVVNTDGSEWVAFRPEQIKSAIGNSGAFDPNNPDIRKSAERQDRILDGLFVGGAKVPDVKRRSPDASVLTGDELGLVWREATANSRDLDDAEQSYEIYEDKAGDLDGKSMEAVTKSAPVLFARDGGSWYLVDGAHRTNQAQNFGERITVLLGVPEDEVDDIRKSADRRDETIASLRARRDLPFGQISPRAWGEILRRQAPEEYEQLAAAGVFEGEGRIYKDELIGDYDRRTRPADYDSRPKKPTAAGVLFQAQDTGRVLLVKRGSRVTAPGTWSVPGGAIDAGETPEMAALREAGEEIKFSGQPDLRLWTQTSVDGVVFNTYIAEVPSEFGTRLNQENSEAKWFDPDSLPQGLHPGMAESFKTPLRKSADRQTDTPEFKRWFGDSKVVDGRGRPLVVYHGTTGDFDVFRDDIEGRAGFYFTNDKAFANSFAEGRDANVMPVYLSITNPADLRRGVPGSVYDALEGQGYSRLVELYESDPQEIWNFFDGDTELSDALQRAGYDGMRLSEPTGRREVFSWVAFRPDQIKSAIGNIGAFDPNNPDITKSADRPWFDDLSKLKVSTNYQLGDLFKTSKKLNWWNRTVGTQYNLAQKNPEFKRVFDAVQTFINDVSAYASRAADLAPTILPRLETLRDITKSPLSAEDVKALRDPIFGGTLKYTRDDEGNIIETDDVSKAGVVFTNEELRDLFGLNDRQVKLYREFRRAINKSLSDLAVADMLRYLGRDGEGVRQRALEATNLDGALNAMVAHLDMMIEQQPERAKVLEDSKRAIKEKAGQAIGLMARGYAPLSRFGQYTVYAVGKDGEQLYFSMFENERDANKMAREMREQYPEATVTAGTMSQESYKLFSGVTPETLALFGESLGLEESGIDAKSEVFQQYLKMAKTNRSAMKRLIQRKGIDGFSEDAGRVLAGFVYSNARQVSTNLHASEIGRAASSIQDGDVKDHAIRLMQYIQNPTEEAQALKGLLFNVFLGGNISSALVNLSQTATTTFPYLSQFDGAASVMKRLGDATKLVARGIRGDDELRAALKRAEDEGIVSPQEVFHLMAQAQGKAQLQTGDGTRLGDALAKTNNFMTRATLVWGRLFSAAEQANRRIAFIAAYKMARDKGMENPFAFAEKAVLETQFSTNKGIRPAWARGAVGGVLFTFKGFTVAYLELLGRMLGNGPEGKKAFGLALGTLFLFAGAAGLPFMDDLDDAIDAFAQRVLGKSFDSKQAKREFFASILGQTGADFVMGGISSLPGAPIDVSGRLGLGNIVPGTGILPKKDNYQRDAMEVFGPAGSLFTNYATAVGLLAQGEVKAAATTAAPLGFQNLIKGMDMAQLGFYRDTRGRKVIDTNGWEAVAKSMGFQPASVKTIQDATVTQQGLISQNKLRETEIADKMAKARIERKPELEQEAREELADWNKKNPESPIRIDASQINKRVQQAMMTKARRLEKTAPQEIRQSVKRELERVNN